MNQKYVRIHSTSGISEHPPNLLGKISRAPSRKSAYTLLEILVVVGVFSILGSVLVSLLYGGIRIWRKGEAGRQSFVKAQVALEQLKNDLVSVSITEAPGKFSPARPPEIRFLCRYVETSENSGIYHQELAFVRTIPQQVKNAFALTAGDNVDNDGDNSTLQGDGKDNDGDQWMIRNNGLDDDSDSSIDEADESSRGTDETGEGIDEEWYNLTDDDEDGKVDEDVRPLGDLMQVRYQWVGDELLRGVQAPLAASRDPLDPVRDLDADPERFSITATPTHTLISGVIYFGIRFWTPHTTGWDEALGKGDPDNQPDPVPGGPEEIWDSTRGLTLGARAIPITNPAGSGNVLLPALDARPASANKRSVNGQPLEFYYYKLPSGTLTNYNYRPPVLPASATDTFFDPSDDVYPRRVQVTLVVTQERGSEQRARLLRDLTDSEEDVILVDDTAVFQPDKGKSQLVKIGEEWIRYSFIKDTHTLVVANGGRGQRGTLPAAHFGGADVLTGSIFTLTLDLPAYREFKE